MGFSASGGEAHLAWADHWGTPRGHMAIGGRQGELQQESEGIFVIEGRRRQRRPMRVRTRTHEDSLRFIAMYKHFWTLGSRVSLQRSNASSESSSSSSSSGSDVSSMDSLTSCHCTLFS